MPRTKKGRGDQYVSKCSSGAHVGRETKDSAVAKAPQSNRKCGNAAHDTVEDQTK